MLKRLVKSQSFTHGAGQLVNSAYDEILNYRVVAQKRLVWVWKPRVALLVLAVAGRWQAINLSQTILRVRCGQNPDNTCTYGDPDRELISTGHQSYTGYQAGSISSFYRPSVKSESRRFSLEREGFSL